MKTPLIIGTYTSEIDSSSVEPSEGLYLSAVDNSSGQFTQPELLASIDNPSFVAMDAEHQRLYVASENTAGELAAFQWNAESKTLELINKQSSLGAFPCYVALSPDGSQVAVANYGTGNVAVFNLDPESGALLDQPQERQHAGQGINIERQEGPHAHWVQWSSDGHFLYVVDLGIDRVMGYPVSSGSDGQAAALGEGFVAWQAEAGAGPRHLVFHPSEPLVYILNELNNTIAVAQAATDGTFATVQTINMLPEDFAGHSQGAHIAISADGSNLYASNRGHNSIVVFEIAANGQLSVLQWVGTEGDWPRYFSLLPDESRLIVANERSHNLVAFTIDEQGKLSPAGQGVQVAQPVYAAPLFEHH